MRAGARQVQGTLNGLGERCGNANLVVAHPHPGAEDGLRDRHLTASALQQLTHLSRLLDERLNRAPTAAPPMSANSRLRPQGRPACLGGREGPADLRACRAGAGGQPPASSSSPTSPGRSNILARFRDIGLEVDANDPKVARLRRDGEGARITTAMPMTAPRRSFELLARRALDSVPEYFRCSASASWTSGAGMPAASSSPCRRRRSSSRSADEQLMTVAEGNGPVNALDAALRKALLAALSRARRTCAWSISRCASSRPRRHRGGHPGDDRERRQRRASAGRPSASPPTSSTPPTRRCTTPSPTSCSATAPNPRNGPSGNPRNRPSSHVPPAG